MRKTGFGALIKAKGMTQASMAKRFGVTGATVSRWVSGASLPEPQLLVRICREFAVSADELLGLGPPGKRAVDPAEIERTVHRVVSTAVGNMKVELAELVERFVREPSAPEPAAADDHVLKAAAVQPVNLEERVAALETELDVHRGLSAIATRIAVAVTALEELARDIERRVSDHNPVSLQRQMADLALALAAHEERELAEPATKAPKQA